MAATKQRALQIQDMISSLGVPEEQQELVFEYWMEWEFADPEGREKDVLACAAQDVLELGMQEASEEAWSKLGELQLAGRAPAGS